MSDTQFSAVTALFTIGGLLGSMLGKSLTDKYGRRGAIKFNAVLVGIGAGLMTVANSISMLLIGR